LIPTPLVNTRQPAGQTWGTPGAMLSRSVSMATLRDATAPRTPFLDPSIPVVSCRPLGAATEKL
jgi:hypothetical protein